MFKHSKSLVLCALVLMATVVLSVGCTDNKTNDNIKNYGRIRLLYKNLPDDVESMFISYYNEAGSRMIEQPKVVNISEFPEACLLYAVDIRCKSLAVGCYDKEAARVKYFFSTRIELKANETKDIEVAEFTPADKVNFRSFCLDVESLRAHTGDYISFESIASVGTDADHYWMDLSDFSTWTVEKDQRLSATDSADRKLLKGSYRCLNTVDDDVPVKATFGSYTAEGDVDITEATVSETELFSNFQDAKTFTNAIGESGVVQVPTGADYCRIYQVAKWSDNEISLCNTSSSWARRDDNQELATNRGRIRANTVENTESDAERSAEELMVQATYTSGSKEFVDSCKIKVVEATLTGIVVKPETLTVAKDDDFALIATGVYGSGVEVELDRYAYTVSSDVPTCVEPDANNVFLFTAKDVGTAVLTFTDKVKGHTAKCTVTVE